MKIFHLDKQLEKYEDVTPELLKQEKVRLLLIDLDNTIRLHSEKVPSDGLIAWAKSCTAAGVKVVIVTNNCRRKFINSFCAPLGVETVGFAKKPLAIELNRIMRKNGFKPAETVMLGDKWSTDVIAANLAGIRAWKVKHRRDLKSS